MFEKVKEFFRGLPWLYFLAGLAVVTLILLFLVKGGLMFTDWIIAFVITFIVFLVVSKVVLKKK